MWRRENGLYVIPLPQRVKTLSGSGGASNQGNMASEEGSYPADDEEIFSKNEVDS